MDVSGDGKVSLDEYMDICDEYGVQISEEGHEELLNVFGSQGEKEVKLLYIYE